MGEPRDCGQLDLTLLGIAIWNSNFQGSSRSTMELARWGFLAAKEEDEAGGHLF